MRAIPFVFGLGLAAAAASLPAHAGPPAPPLVKFNGAIGVDPVTGVNGVDQPNVVRGINPGGRAWVIRKLKATVGTDGRIVAQGAGLLFASGEVIGTRGPVSAVVATLACGAADDTAKRFTSPPAALDASGNFRIDGMLSEDGVNPAVMPATCSNPALLVRAYNTTTQIPGGWFAAGIPVQDDD